MFRTAAATILFSAVLALGAPGAAIADEQAEFEAMCRAAGLEVVDGKCVYEDGSTLSCSWRGDDWLCYRSEPKPTISRLFEKLTNTPKIIVTKPVHPGPVETSRMQVKPKLKIDAPSQETFSATNEAHSGRSMKLFDAPVRTEASPDREASLFDAGSIKSEISTESSIRSFDAPVMQMETVSIAPMLKLQSFN